jgi:hypothetical protein
MTRARGVPFSNASWKILIVGLSLLCGVLLIADIASNWRLLYSGQGATLGISIKPGLFRGTYQIPLLKIAPTSPLIEAGVHAGDIIEFDRYQDARRRFAPGESIGMTVRQSGEARHLSVAAVPVALTATFYFSYWGSVLISVISLFFAMLVIFSRPESIACRALALSFALDGFNFISSAIAQPELHTLGLFLWYATLPLAPFLFVVFAASFSREQSISGSRFDASWPVWALVAYSAAMSLYGAWFGSGHAAPLIGDLTTMHQALCTVLGIAALWHGCRASVGVGRQRQMWMLATYVMFSSIQVAGFIELTYFFNFMGNINGIAVSLLLQVASNLVWFFVLIYALLVHRIFNFGFAVNRAIFYSITSVLMLVSFGIVERLFDHFLHFEGRTASVLVDGGIALGVYLAFNRFHYLVDHWMERIFFAGWHKNESRLRVFVTRAAHIKSSQALLREFALELKRFSGGAECKIFLPANGHYESLPAVGQDVAMLDIDDPICIRLRTDPAPFEYSSDPQIGPTRLVLSMSHRSILHAVIILGPKCSGESYRPDEKLVLGFAAHQTGLDLHAISIESLVLENDKQRMQLAALRELILTAPPDALPVRLGATAQQTRNEREVW